MKILITLVLTLGLVLNAAVAYAMPPKESVYQTQKPMTTEMTFESAENFRRVLKISDEDVINLVAKEENIKKEDVKFLDVQTLADNAIAMPEHDKRLNLKNGMVLSIKEAELVKYDVVKIDRTYLKNFKYIQFEGKKRLTAEYMSPIGYLSEDRETTDSRPYMAEISNGSLERRWFPEKYKEGNVPSITGATDILSGTWYKVFLTSTKNVDNIFVVPPKASPIKTDMRDNIVAGIKIEK
ncbi:MAG: hypothetical protein ACRC76_02635 [Proteocatella sp.]